jgi:hypothetical protein
VWWSFSARVCVMEKGLNCVCGVREESESPMRVEEELFLRGGFLSMQNCISYLISMEI